MKSNLPVIHLPSGPRIWTGLAYRNPHGDILSFQLLSEQGTAVGHLSMDSGTAFQLPLIADSVPHHEAEAFEAFGRACMEAQGGRRLLFAEYAYPSSPNAEQFNAGKGFWHIQSGLAGPMLAIAESEADAREFVAGVNR